MPNDIHEAPGASAEPRTRAPVQLPDGMRVTTTSTEAVIRRRWLRPKHWFLLALFGTAGAYVAYQWSTAGSSAWLIVATLFVLNFNYNIAAMFLNGTEVSANSSGVAVRHGPLPTVFARNARVEKGDIAQLYAAQHGPHFAVLAKVKSGEELRLVAPLVAKEQALFIEQQLERILGLVDFAVEGELGNDAPSSVEGKKPAGASSGAALALLIPLFVVGTIALMLVATSTEVSGRLQASGSLGSWVFEPNDCMSGQREGFGGVVLKSAAQPGRVVRVVQDPVRGSLVVVASQGEPNQVFGDKPCARFDVNVQRSSTNINDIWAMNGTLAIDCGELSGSVKFETCH